MIATQTLPAVGSLHLDAMLADALVLSWSDLMPELTSGLIHVEYHVGSHGAVEYLKVWAALTRGQWDLVCQNFMRSSASCQGGLRFANGYKSEGLAKMLNQILQHPEMFVLSTAPGTDRLIQIPPPTQKDTLAARGMVEALGARLAE
jgi:hypothetical protein